MIVRNVKDVIGTADEVRTDTWVSRRVLLTRTVPFSRSMCSPTSSSRSTTASKWSRFAFFRINSPLVMAAAMMKVAVSIRSGITRCSQAVNLSTPSILISGVPYPVIFAPILFSSTAQSETSGSHAAPTMTVSPSAIAAAAITLIVPSTVGPCAPPRYIRAPFRRPRTSPMMLPLSIRNWAPSFCSPRKCRSTGRSPIAAARCSRSAASWSQPA